MKTIFAAESRLHEGQRAMTTERLVNMFAEVAPGRLPVTLRSCPGLVQVGQFASGRVEALQSTPDGIYAVCGGKLALWDGATFSTKASVPDGRATTAYNGSEVGIVSGGKYNVWDGTSLTNVNTGAFQDFGAIDMVNGYFLLTEKVGDRHAVTGINDGKTLNALDFASAEYSSDDLRRVVVNGGLIWYMGSQTVEPWQDTGGADYPFSRLSSTVLEKGVRSAPEVVKLDNTIFWNSDEARSYRQVDFQPQKISTHSVDASLENHTNAVCFAYQHQGHDFYVTRFDDRPAWVYGPSTQSYHERSTGTSLGAWEVTATVHHNGVWYAGTKDGYLCTFGGFQDRGEELRREAISRNISNEGKRFVVNRVDVRMDVGSGGTVMSSYSPDGGRTFSPERYRGLGTTYNKRQQWRGLGQHREFAFRLACTDNVDFAIYEAGVN